MDVIPLPVGKTWHAFFLHPTVDTSKPEMHHLIDIMERNGFKCGYYERDFSPGESVIGNLTTCIGASLVIIPWISAAFLQNKYCMTDLEIATFAMYFSDQKIIVLPLFYHVLLDETPEIVKIASYNYFEVKKNNSPWTDQFTQFVLRKITPPLSTVSPQNEADILYKNYKEMSDWAKIMFALKSSSSIFFEIPDKLNSLSESDLRDIFGLCFNENKKCSRLSVGSLPCNVECIKSFSFSLNISYIDNAAEICGEEFIKKLSQICASDLGKMIPIQPAFSEICAGFEYILSNPLHNECRFHLCYECIQFEKDNVSEPIQFFALVVYDVTGTQILRTYM